MDEIHNVARRNYNFCQITNICFYSQQTLEMEENYQSHISYRPFQGLVSQINPLNNTSLPVAPPNHGRIIVKAKRVPAPSREHVMTRNNAYHNTLTTQRIVSEQTLHNRPRIRKHASIPSNTIHEFISNQVNADMN